jgi:guanylate cyclase soluble subunit beta
MVHNGIRALVVQKLGEKEWVRIEREAKIGPTDFIGLTVYDDALTFRIADIAAKALDLPMGAFMRELGRFWIAFAQKGPFGSIMDFTGSDLVSFISNLDRLHRAVAATLIHGSMPSFSLIEQSEDRLVVLYKSERAGLENFVIGLLEGLLDRFGNSGSVQYNGQHENGSEEFLITLS